MSRPEEIFRGLAANGPRVAGTEAGARALHILSGILHSLGFETERQEFDCTLWMPEGEPRLHLEGESARECAPMIGSISGYAVGRLVAHGRMLIWGDKSWHCYGVAGESGEALAYVLVRPDGPAAPQPLPPGAAEVPYVVVGAADADAVGEASISRRTVCVQLRSSTKPARGCNLRAWIGREDPLGSGGTVFVTAHVDTVPGTPGAYDNAGGLTALVAVARRLAEEELPPRVQLLVTDAEELHLLGSRAFVGHLEKNGLLQAVSGCLNLDGAGRGEVLDVWMSPHSLAERVRSSIGESRARFTFPPPQSGDHTAFVERGIPAMMLTFDDPEIIHRAEDIYEESKLNNALRMGRIATDILQCLTREGVW